MVPNLSTSAVVSHPPMVKTSGWVTAESKPPLQFETEEEIIEEEEEEELTDEEDNLNRAASSTFKPVINSSLASTQQLSRTGNTSL